MKKLVQKHQTFLSELTAHEPRVSDTINRCEQLIGQSNVHAELNRPLEKVKSSWEALKAAAERRRVELDEALAVANYFAEASEAEAWIREKEQLIVNEVAKNDLGRDEDAAESMLKRQSAILVDIEAFGQNTAYGDLR